MYMNISKRIVIFIAFLILLLGVGGVWYWEKSIKNSSDNRQFIKYQDPKLTDAEKAVFTERLADYKKKLSEAKEKDDRFTYLMQVGLQYYALGQFANAREQYLRASEILPNNPTVWSELYVVESAMGDYVSAKEHIVKALDINPANVQYWRWRFGLEEDNLGTSDTDLEKLFDEAVTKTNQNVDVLVLYAIFLEERRRDLPRAIAQWRLAATINPEGKSTYDEQIKRIQSLVK